MDKTSGAPVAGAVRGLGRLWQRKSVDQVQAEYASSELKRSLGAVNLVLLGIGCIIGAGIFVRTGTAAALHAGPAVILSFVIAGLICAFAGLCYAELASALPVSGSAYTYAYTTLGEFVAWMMGALLVLEYGLAASVVAAGWAGYVVSFLHDFNIVIPPELTAATGKEIILADGGTGTALFNLPAAAIVIALASLLVLGISESATVNNIIVAIKVSVILAFIVVGAFHVNPANWTPFIPEPTGEPGEFGWGGVLRAATIVFFAYIGFEAISTAGQEARNPKRDLPIGIIGSLVICTVLYMATSAVLTGVVPYAQLDSPAPVADAVNAFGAGWAWLGTAIKIGAIAGLTSVILVLMYGQTRIFYTMARDGLLPGVLSRVHPTLKTPWINTLVVAVLVAVAAGLFDINTLGDLTSIGTLAAFAIVCISVIWLRQTRPDLPRGFKTPLYPITPILGILSCLFLIFQVEPRVQLFFLVFLVGAVAVYFVYSLHHSKLGKGVIVSGHEPSPDEILAPPPH
ncbi:amino acid permease [bacterium]|nr:amino acid permease [bacterium]